MTNGEEWAERFTIQETPDPPKYRHVRARRWRLLVILVVLATQWGAAISNRGFRETLPVAIIVGVLVAGGFLAFVRRGIGGIEFEAAGRLRVAGGYGGVMLSIEKNGFDSGYDYLWLERGHLWSLAEDGSRSEVADIDVVLLRGESSGKLVKILFDSPEPRAMRVYAMREWRP
ncbi:MAG: hypothetical protein GXP35_13650 [Actinobacteria bacterium]|nr:hypothetical protein [Actinomycetota bacterium]